MAELQLNSGFRLSRQVEISTEVHCSAGNVLTKVGKAQIGICRFPRGVINGRNKDKSYLGGSPIARPIGGILRVDTSSYAGGIEDVFQAFDTAIHLKNFLA